jgi:hypothetical protein
VIGIEPQSPITAATLNYCDHYHGVPLSDGFHILFIDPESGMLCLGNDTPVGHPYRLYRKIKFLPVDEGLIPRIFAAGTDLTNGARIVAAYGDQLVLFSVPPDILNLSKKEASSEQWKDWWHEAISGPVWPLSIRGTVLGKADGLVDIAMNQCSGLAVWALALDGQAFIWRTNV